MPYVNVKVMRAATTTAQKAQVNREVTEVKVHPRDHGPQTSCGILDAGLRVGGEATIGRRKHAAQCTADA